VGQAGLLHHFAPVLPAAHMGVDLGGLHSRLAELLLLLTAFLATHFGLVLSRDSVRCYLHRPGWRWARPRLAPVQERRPDPLAQERRGALALAREEAELGKARLVYLDESDLHLLPLIRAMGMKGRRIRVA
jgi:hypothetical protein